MDCIRLHAAGLGCAVAPLGTALTGEQARVLARYTRQVVLAYDADAPGLRSTFRAAADPITRGLYLARAAEKSGVAREILEQEVGRLDARAARRGLAAGGTGG